jgi:hypothetical protein
MTRKRSQVRVLYRPLSHFPQVHSRRHTPPNPQGFRGFVFRRLTPWERFGALLLPDLLPVRERPFRPPLRLPSRSGHRGFAGSAGPRSTGNAPATPRRRGRGTAPPDRRRTMPACCGTAGVRVPQSTRVPWCLSRHANEAQIWYPPVPVLMRSPLQPASPWLCRC